MASRRPDRIASVIQAELTRMLREDVNDPTLGPVTITEVAVNPDLSVARVRWVPLGGIGDRKVLQVALEGASRRLRGPIGRVLGIRHAPELRFELDKNVEYVAHMDEVFRNLPKPAPDDEEGG